MTTAVTIKAHCAANIEVRVTIRTGREIVEEFTLQDGEVADRYVYDERAILVQEVSKDAALPIRIYV